MKRYLLFALAPVALLGVSSQTLADNSAVKVEMHRLLEAVNDACGFKAGQTPNMGADCMRARDRMQNFNRQHAKELKELEKEKLKLTMLQLQEYYEKNCSSDPSTNECVHRRAVIEQGKIKMQKQGLN